MDDALTLTYLFAALPSNTAIKAKMGGKAKTLAAAWGAYCATAGCITKSFISVKGVYLEATIRGVPIRWVVPHSFTQFMPEDVDYKVMATFFEFYETLLHFVLFKLYNDMGVRYPLPVVEGGDEVKGSASVILGANLRSLTNAFNSSESAITEVVAQALEEDKEVTATPESAQIKSKVQKKKERALLKTVGSILEKVQEDDDVGIPNIDEDDDMDDDAKDVDIAGPLKAALESMAEDEAKASVPGGESSLDDDAIKRRRLFAGLTFFLSREVPRGYLELMCLAYGAKLGWEGPNSPISVNDPTITHHIVDRPKLPSSYSCLPKSREFVQPQWILDCSNFMFLLPIAKYGAGATLPPHLSPWVDNEEEGYKPAYAEEIERLKNGEPMEEANEENDEEVEMTEKTSAIVDDEAEMSDAHGDDDIVESSVEEEEEEDDDTKAKRAAKNREREEKEAHELSKSMMSRKAAHLYSRMQHGLAKKQSKVEALQSRRREVEHSKEKDEDGRTLLKQKVERLKKDRKRIEDEYADTGGSMKRSKKNKKRHH